MRLGNNHAGYGWLSIFLHWTVVAGIVAMFAIGLNAEWASEAGDREQGRALMGLHISLGATLFALFALRIIAHYAQPQPDAPPGPAALTFVASAVQHLMLLAILILIVSGPLAVFSGGRAINVWDIASIPSPFAARNEGVHEAAEAAHAVGRFMLFGLVPLHILGALKHVFVDKGRVFWRMLVVQKEG